MTTTAWAAERLGTVYRGQNLVRQERGAQGGVAVTLRRPRAAAGPAESVSLRLRPESRTLFGGRFFASAFDLSQQIAFTQKPAADGLALVAASKGAIFEGAGTLGHARVKPAFAYYEQLEKARFEPLVAHLIAGPGFKLRREDHPSDVRTLLLISTDDAEPSALEVNAAGELKKNGSKFQFVSEVAQIHSPQGYRLVGTPLEEGAAQIAEELLSEFHLLSIPLTPALDALAATLLAEDKNLPTLYLSLTVFGRESDGDAYQRKDSFVWATLAPLNRDRGVRAPQFALTLLSSKRRDASRQVSAAGFGRLSDDSFTPVRPSGVKANNVVWSRLAQLRSLERMDGDDARMPRPFDYDVVLYGPGGELIPTTLWGGANS